MSPPAVPSTPSSDPSATAPVADQVTVASVTDGDTIVVSGGVRVPPHRHRPPETRHADRGLECFGPEASARTAALLEPGEPVRLVYDLDRADPDERTLAHMYRVSDDQFVNAALVQDGLRPGRHLPAEHRPRRRVHCLEDEARSAGRGLWTACSDTVTPQTQPSPPVAIAAPSAPTTGPCHPAYPDVCIPPAPPNLDCADIPHRSFRILPPDPTSSRATPTAPAARPPDRAVGR